MPITIVSALPKSAPAPAPEASASVENTDSASDFASLLLGQLAEALPTGGPAVEGALASAMEEVGEKEADSQGSVPGDPLALLAALVQAPVEQRNDVAAGTAPTATTPLPGTETAPLANAGPALGNSALIDRMAQNTEAAPPPLPLNQAAVPASDGPAKFAAKPFGVSSDALPGSSEIAEALPAATNDTPPSVIAQPAGIHANRDTPATLSVPTPVRDRDWNNDFAQKVVWIATSQKQAAELTLNPPTMGSIEISLQIDNDRSTATATFVSANAEVRETIETALPRLREMFAGVGIELGQANVSAESFRQASNENGAASASRSGNDKAILGPDVQASRNEGRVAARMGRGLVDTFA